MAFLRSESVSEGVKNLVFPGIEGGGGRGGGGGRPAIEGMRRGSWKVGGITLFLEIKIPVFFSGHVARSRSAH